MPKDTNDNKTNIKTIPSDDAILLEQWKTACSLAVEESKKRMSINQYMITILTMMLGTILFSTTLNTSIPIVRAFIVIVICVVEVLVCENRKNQLTYYRELIGKKYDIIRELECKLPEAVLTKEFETYYSLHQKGSNNPSPKDKSFSLKEQQLPYFFEAAIIFIGIIMVIATISELSPNGAITP